MSTISTGLPGTHTPPFIHKFQTKNAKYVYDVNSNRVFHVSDAEFALVDSVHTPMPNTPKTQVPGFSAKLLKQANARLLAARHRGLLSSARPTRMAFTADASLSRVLHNVPKKQLILGITEQCNMRCAYCVYSGLYNDQRTHSTAHLAESIATKAIRMFLSNCEDGAFISFYGGEPLLHLSLIKHLVESTERIATRHIQWSMTTNGLLLDRDTCQYCISKKFFLTVSIDGPRSVHDRYRVTTTKTPTLDRIMRNLRCMRSLDEVYYNSHVGFSAVLTPPYALRSVHRFFKSSSLLKTHPVFLSYMSWAGTPFLRVAQTAEHSSLDRDERRMKRAYMKDIITSTQRDRLSQSVYEADIARHYHRPMTALGDTIRPNGCCLPSARRLFVSARGTYHLCERLDNAYPIGNVSSGLDMSAIENLAAEYIRASTDCLTCWACRLCSTCFATTACNGRLGGGHRQAMCADIRARIHRMLVFYYESVEANPRALDFLGLSLGN